MLNKFNYIFIFLICLAGHAQTEKLDKANDEYDALAFIEAREGYLKLIDKGEESADIFAKLGDTYFFNDELNEAYVWYEKLFTNYQNDVTPEYYFRYAQALKSVERYAQADSFLKQYSALKGYNGLSSQYDKESDYLESIEFQSGRYQIENSAQINSFTSDFGPAFFNSNNKIVFATARDTMSLRSRRHKWNNQSFLQLYTADSDDDGTLSSPVKMPRTINSKFHESTPVFTSDGNTMYFTRNNYVKGSYGEDSKGINRLKIYRTVYIDGKWGKPESLPFNDDEYSAAHPALSPDGTKLYFSSDMPGSMGVDSEDALAKSDIWVVDILGDDQYSEPENVTSINTPGRETFPFISSDSTLYFASSGHLGLGGLDVFATTIENDGSYSQVFNVGKPINTPFDDFGFIIDSESKIGYLSSNRPGGAGDDDIYRIIETDPLRNPCVIVANTVVMDYKTGEPISDVSVTLMNIDGTALQKVLSDQNGKYSFELDCESEYLIVAQKDGYLDDEKPLITADESSFVDVQLELKNISDIVDCDDIAAFIGIETIYFDFDKSDIRPDAAEQLSLVVQYMKQFPETNIDIRSHTDSRGSDRYNEKLSDRRAQSTREWIISEGIDPERLSAKGYGESRLLNNCSNGVRCAREQHQLNRRSEFIVTGLESYKDCK